MFELNKHKAIVTDLSIITDNYLELLADENPVLYTGSNRYGNRILGIIIEESDDFTLHYFHVIIDDYLYYEFINKKIPLKAILKMASLLFVVSKKGKNIIDNNIVAFEEVPEDYLPLEDSFCPDGFFIPSLNFGISLKGKKADNHIVEIPEANSIQTSFGEVLKNALQTLDELDLQPKCYLEPAETGSFRVNYRIEFEPQQASLFHVDDQLIADYINSLLNFIIDKLPNEEYTLKQKDIDSESFKAVEDTLEQIYESSHIGVPDEKVIKDKLAENINKAALKFEDVANQIKNSNSFNKIEVLNYQQAGGEVGLGLIDETFFESIKGKLDIEEPKMNVSVIEEDLVPQTYRIRVYHLNTESGNCWALYYPNETEYNFKIPIRIRKNDKEYHHSILSKSLDEQKVVNITGYGERTDGKISSITVDL